VSETTQATVAHYVRDTIIVLLLFGSLAALVVWGVRTARRIEKEHFTSGVLRCPSCGAELELQKKRERSKE
jgi:hypothetical protein